VRAVANQKGSRRVEDRIDTIDLGAKK